MLHDTHAIGDYILQVLGLSSGKRVGAKPQSTPGIVLPTTFVESAAPEEDRKFLLILLNVKFGHAPFNSPKLSSGKGRSS